MNPDFQEKFRSIIKHMEEAGIDYAEKKAKSWQAQELKHAVLSEEMKKMDKTLSFNLKESLARSSDGYIKYLQETADAIKEENIAKAIYEKWKSSFEALRSLSSLEKRTMSLVDGD